MQAYRKQNPKQQGALAGGPGSDHRNSNQEAFERDRATQGPELETAGCSERSRQSAAEENESKRGNRRAENEQKAASLRMQGTTSHAEANHEDEHAAGPSHRKYRCPGEWIHGGAEMLSRRGRR